MKKMDVGAPRMPETGSMISTHSPVSRMKMEIIEGPQYSKWKWGFSTSPFSQTSPGHGVGE